MLTIISTPIGNLQDISLRALETLKSVAYILAEDTRHSLQLLRHFGIEKRLVSFHELNERPRQDAIIKDLLSGKEIALISDAGTPLVSDPGFLLVQECIRQKIPYTTIPGPSAVISALVLCGFSPTPFQFVGFLPKKQQELARQLNAMVTYTGTSLAFESPHRIQKTLTLLTTLAPQARLAIVREITKQFEECLRGTAAEILSQKNNEWRGEMVLCIEGILRKKDLSDSDVKEYIHELMHSQGLSKKEALQVAAKSLDLSKRNLYRLMISESSLNS